MCNFSNFRQILPGLEPPENAEIIEAEGRWLLPAGIDLHCELDNADDLSNACKDALSGGTATVSHFETKFLLVNIF